MNVNRIPNTLFYRVSYSGVEKYATLKFGQGLLESNIYSISNDIELSKCHTRQEGAPITISSQNGNISSCCGVLNANIISNFGTARLNNTIVSHIKTIDKKIQLNSCSRAKSIKTDGGDINLALDSRASTIETKKGTVKLFKSNATTIINYHGKTSIDSSTIGSLKTVNGIISLKNAHVLQDVIQAEAAPLSITASIIVGMLQTSVESLTIDGLTIIHHLYLKKTHSNIAMNFSDSDLSPVKRAKPYERKISHRGIPGSVGEITRNRAAQAKTIIIERGGTLGELKLEEGAECTLILKEDACFKGNPDVAGLNVIYIVNATSSMFSESV